MTIFRSSHQRCSLKKAVLKKFAIFTRKHLSLFNKVAGLKACSCIKMRLQHRCFFVNIAKFVRTPLFTQQLWLLLLNIDDNSYNSDKDIYDYNGSKKLPRGILNNGYPEEIRKIPRKQLYWCRFGSTHFNFIPPENIKKPKVFWWFQGVWNFWEMG